MNMMHMSLIKRLNGAFSRFIRILTLKFCIFNKRIALYVIVRKVELFI